jgi:hypothetical protein
MVHLGHVLNYKNAYAYATSVLPFIYTEIPTNLKMQALLETRGAKNLRNPVHFQEAIMYVIPRGSTRSNNQQI